MRFSLILAKAAAPKVQSPKAPFKRTGKAFDDLFVAPQRRKKAWDGQDKDAFFRDKYAHVHAKQLRRRREEQERKKLKPTPQPPKSNAPAAKPDFARRFASRMESNPKLEYIYGTNAVRAVLASRKCHKLFTGFSSVAEIEPDILDSCRAKDISIETRVPMQHLQIMASQGVHNKYIVETEKRPHVFADSLDVRDGVLEVDGERLVSLDTTGPADTVSSELGPRNFKPSLGLFIDQVTDTHNMGALLRSAQFFGADFVAISARNSAPISPAVVKASSGAAEFIPILEISHPLRLFDDLRAKGWSLVAAGPSARALQASGTHLPAVDAGDLRNFESPTLLVVGNEGDGIRTSLIQRSTHQTTLATRQKQTSSLNVSVAGAVLLHAITS